MSTTSSAKSVFTLATTKALTAAQAARSYGEARVIFHSVVKEFLQNHHDDEFASLLLRVAALSTEREEDWVPWTIVDDEDGTIRPATIDEWTEVISYEVDSRYPTRSEQRELLKYGIGDGKIKNFRMDRLVTHTRVRTCLTEIRQILG